MIHPDSKIILESFGSAFASPVSWIKASPSCKYRFEVQGIGEFRPEFHITAHTHSYYEFGIGLQGTGELALGRERHALRPGVLFVVEPGAIHRLASVESDGFGAFIFTVTPEPIKAIDGEYGLPGIHSSKVLESKELIKILAAWALVNASRIPDPVSTSLFARYIAFEILSVLTRSDDTEKLSLVEHAKERIENRLHGKINVPTVAASLDVSERTLRKHFQTDLNKSVIEFVNERRLAMAERYLAFHISVSDVARLVGFESPSQLTRLFQKSKGTTPKSWQQLVAPTRRIVSKKSEKYKSFKAAL